MSANTVYKSHFANMIENMLLFRESLGLSKEPNDRILMNFDRFCAENYPHEMTLTKSLAMEWGAKRANEKINNQRVRIITLRQFAKYINFMGCEAYIIPTDMMGKQETYEPYLFTDNELTVFFETIDKISATPKSSFAEYTIPVFFRVAYGCGLRPNELLDLRRCDVNLQERTIFVFNSKTKRDRLIMMTADLADVCRKYDGIAQRRFPNRNWFFHIDSSKRIRSQWFKYRLTKYWKLARLDERLGKCPRIYDFRHNHATRVLLKWFDDGKDIMVLMPYLSAYMGYVGLHSTFYYIHLLPDRIRHNKSFDWDKFETLLPEVPYEE